MIDYFKFLIPGLQEANGTNHGHRQDDIAQHIHQCSGCTNTRRHTHRNLQTTAQKQK